MSSALRAGKILALPTLALGFVVGFVPGRAGLAVWIYALVVCSYALAVAVHALRRAFPPSPPLRPRSRDASRATVPGTLARIEQEVVLGVAGSFDLHFRLRPRLQRLTTELLAARRGISVDHDPSAARAALGDDTWELVRPGKSPPQDRFARGVPIADLTRAVDSLEAL